MKPILSEGSIREELQKTLDQIDKQMEAVIEDAKRNFQNLGEYDFDWTIYDIKTSDGRPILIDLITTRANILMTLLKGPN